MSSPLFRDRAAERRPTPDRAQRVARRAKRSRARDHAARCARAITAVAAAAALIVPPSARAEEKRPDDKTACVAAYEHSQTLRKSGKLRRAREQLRQCSHATCPALVRNDCVTWLEQVDAAFPTIVVQADKDGADVANVRVIEDNEVVATRLDGKALEVEPGEHTFRFETEGAPPITATLVVREGEKNRAVPVHFTPPRRAEATAAASTEPPSRPVPVGVYVLGGVGLAGLAGFTALGAIGKSDESHLRDTCSPNCAKSDIDAVRTKYLLADVSLGVGVVSLGAAAIWYLTRPSKSESPPPAAGLAVTPSRGGGVVSWQQAF